MTTTQTLLWLLASAAGVLICGLFAGLETGIYSLNRVRLHLQSHRGDSRARIIAELVAKPAPLLTTILIGTNIATNLATSAMGVIFHARELSEWGIVAAVVLIETPLLFVFAETLPKDLFAANADRLVYPFAKPILYLQRLFAMLGILPLITFTSHIIMRCLRQTESKTMFHPRRQFTALFNEGVGRGLLSDEQSQIVERVMSLAGRRLTNSMIPWDRVHTVDADRTLKHAYELAEKHNTSRMPIMSRDGRVVGMLDVVDTALRDDVTDDMRVGDLGAEPMRLAPGLQLREALTKLQTSGNAIAVVAQSERPLGIVTIKDLVEPITGELAEW